jgi:hypothetical protein
LVCQVQQQVFPVNDYFAAVQDLPLQYVLFYSLPSVLLWAICRDLDLWWPQVAPMLRKYLVDLLLIAFAVGLGIGCLVRFPLNIFTAKI